MEKAFFHKKNTPKLALLTLLLGLSAGGSAQAADVAISDGLVSATIADNGAFSSTGLVGLSFNGTEFVNQGTYASWTWLKADGYDFNQSEAWGSNDLSLTAIDIGLTSTTLAFSGEPLRVVQTISAIGATNTLAVTVSITNTTGADLTNVYWGVGFDPDQDIVSGSTFETMNSITGTGGNAAVSAAGPSSGYTVTLMNNTTSGATDIRGFINVGDCCSDVDPAYAYTYGQVLGYNNYGDDSISLAYSMGTLAAGQTATLGYNYVFAPVPEAETYGMMLAGLGLVGFMVRRRKQA